MSSTAPRWLRTAATKWDDARRRPTRRKETPDAAPAISVRALVLDFGFEPGAEDEFEVLLRVACGDAARAGMTHLAVFTSDASPGSEVLRALASEIERYELATPYTPEPDGAADRGLYVDQVYF